MFGMWIQVLSNEEHFLNSANKDLLICDNIFWNKILNPIYS